MRESVKRDLEMLEYLAIGTKQAICQKYKLSLRGLDSWLHRIRGRRREARKYLNRILALEKRNPRLKKILLSGSENDEDLIEDFGEFER